MEKLIGIISYLPSDPQIRENRKKKLIKLIEKCNNLFNLPILIIAQNWQSFDLNLKNVTVKHYQKLGIVGARKELRNQFLSSSYDYLIMLDDDCELYGDSGKIYLQQIDEAPNSFIEFNKTLLKLFAISKTLFAQVDYADISPEAGEGFEDRIFVNTLRKKFPEKQRVFHDTGIGQHSISTDDPNSTGYKGQDLSVMLNNTLDIIKTI